MQPEARLQVSDAPPPVAVKAYEYGTPVVTAGRTSLPAIVIGETFSVNVRSVVRPDASPTISAKVYEPACVGVPVMVFPDARLRPGGRADPAATAQVAVPVGFEGHERLGERVPVDASGRAEFTRVENGSTDSVKVRAPMFGGGRVPRLQREREGAGAESGHP